MSEFMDIVFDRGPGPIPPQFVEIENDERNSIRFGEWVQRDDFWWVLRIRKEDFK